jgi:protein O-mannosyl-transferase
MPRPIDRSMRQAAAAEPAVRSKIALSLPAWLPLGGAALLAALTFAIYLPSIHGGFLLDDDLLLTKNSLVRSADGLYRIWCTTDAADYWPVTNTAYWIQWRLWGLDPTGYHLVNLGLHIINALLIWTTLKKLRVPGAFLAALLFAVHPVNVESVAWIAQLKNQLSMLFFLLSVRWYPSIQVPRGNMPGDELHKWYWLSLTAFVLAMLSKGSVAVLPLLLLLMIWWLHKRITKRDVARVAPFFFVAVGLTAINIWFQARAATSAIRDVGIVERVLGAGAAVWFYLSKALAPINLRFVYPQWNIRAGELLWWLPLLACAGTITLLVWQRRRAGVRAMLLGFACFCLALVPVLGLVDVGYMKFSLVADHYQHLALIAVTAMAGAGLWQLSTRCPRPIRTLAAVSALAVLGGSMLLSWQQNSIYASPIALYEDTLAHNPDCWMAHNNLGNALVESGRCGEAMEHYQAALRLKPDFADAHYNLAAALAANHRTPEAIEQYRQSLQLKPDRAEAHNNLGVLLLAAGQGAAAVEQFRIAAALQPNFVDAHVNFGNALVRSGSFSQAIPELEWSVRLNPRLAAAHNNLGAALAGCNRTPEAIDHYRQAVSLDPNYVEARYNLGLALLAAGRPGEAVEHFQRIVRHQPQDLEVQLNLAIALTQMNRRTEAISVAQRAIDIARLTKQDAVAKQLEFWLSHNRWN